MVKKLGECENCEEWCNDNYKYCWHCNKEEIEQSCKDCGIPFWGERWKTQCKQCYFEDQDIPYNKKKTIIKEDIKQTKLSDFFNN